VAGKIFINYRRSDDPRSIGALYGRLEQEFGRDNVLMDEEAYAEPGPGYARELAALVARGDVVLAVIGPRWLERLAMRAGDPEDFVQIEIEAALYQHRPAIPVLVGGATLPRAEELPEAIRGLVRRGSVSLRPGEFEADCDSLVNALKQAFAAAGRANRRPEAARQAAHAPQAGQRAHQHAPATSAHEDDREAEELANWNYIKGSKDPDVFRSHLDRFPSGPTGNYALSRIQTLQAGQARQQHAHNGGYLGREKPPSEAEAWTSASTATSLRELEQFIADWPNGAYAERARRRIEELRREGASKGEAFGLIVMLSVVALVIGLIALASVKF
jgi:hypothetical protein